MTHYQEQQQQRALKINNDLRNRQFESWKLATGDPSPARAAAPLPHGMRVRLGGGAEALDYLRTRAAALRNHLVQSDDGRLYALCDDAGTAAAAAAAALAIVEVAAASSGSGGSSTNNSPPPPRVATVAELPVIHSNPGTNSGTGDGAGPRTTEAPLDASLVAVAVAASDIQQQQQRLLLVSEGFGDLRLVVVSDSSGSGGGSGGPQQPATSTSSSRCSQPLYPLRPPPPLAGARPFVLLDAVALPAAAAAASSAADSGSSSGSVQIHAIVWAVREGPSGGPRGRHCEAYALALRAGAVGGGGAPTLELEAAQQLAASADAPYGAIADPRARTLLLAAAPPPDDDGCADGGSGEARLGAAGLGASNGGVGAAAGADAVNGSNDANGNGNGGDDDGDDIDPCTLAAAAARLASLTSERAQTEPPPQQQWTDIYREGEPDGGAAAASEPSCDVTLFALRERGGQGAWERVDSVHGGAHTLLAVQRTVGGSGGSGGSGSGGGSSSEPSLPPGLLLGVSDDVDCAAFRAAAAASAAAVAAEHVGSVPALAYVAAGKTQRRHVLVAEPGAPVSAAIVEGARYAYVYGAVPAGAASGPQRVLELGLRPGGGRVVGAALLGGGSAATAGSMQLLVLAEDEVVCFGLV